MTRFEKIWSHPPSYWLRLFSSQTFSRINTPNFLKSSHTSYLPAYEDGTECSETSAYKIPTPWSYPEESIQHSEHGESLKSRTLEFSLCDLQPSAFTLVSSPTAVPFPYPGFLRFSLTASCNR